ncbi:MULTISPECIES: isochorismatase family protein [unclassified Novosphingobium]|uniref:isochorismatase family protein n=1 Tax=unclassified Novosphingobium TaxID=2644732 RepID=UPI001494BF4D|nr:MULTISPECIES: isochorismatase family protein [unclassified Novosphingobium]
MPVTRLDPKSALIVVDLQKGVAGMVPPETFEPVVVRSRALAEAFRAKDLPVVLVNVDGVAPGRTEQPSRASATLPPGFAELVDEVGAQPSDIRVTKKTWGAFASTDLEHQLRTLGVTQVVIAGVSTATGVEATARQAYEAGFNVTLVIDAMIDPRPGAHDHSISQVFPRLGETGTTDDILRFLEGRA